MSTRIALGVAFLVLAATACTTGGGGGAGGPGFTVTASSATIQFGDAVPAITPTYGGLPDGVTEPPTPATCFTAATPTSAPGVYDTACFGAASSGYYVDYLLGTITIEAAPVTVTASSGSMPFGGSVPTITASYSGLKNGATTPAVLPVCSTTATSASDVGSYPSSCSGADDPNYTFTYVDGSVSVGTAVVTVTASSATTTYGGAVPAITATYSGFQGGQTVPAHAATCSTPANSTKPAGTYPTSCSGATDPNYTFSYVNGSVTIGKAPVVVTASSGAIAFHSTPPAITASYSGLLNGALAPATLPACSTTATSSSPVGVYPTTCSGAADPNYTFTYVNGSMVVTAAAAPVVVTASSATIAYGATVPAITAAYAGFTGGQTTPATLPTCTTTATSTSPVGTYPTTCVGAADPNYSFTNVNGSITIAKKVATVTASSGSMTYGGTVPAVTPSYSGLVNGQPAPATPPTCSTFATSTSPVGAYPTTCTGAADPNYTFNSVAGSISVDKANLTVTASSATMSLGSVAPAITGAITGFVNGDTSVTTPPTCTSTATPSSPIGRQTSSCSGAADSDYTFSYVAGSVQVNPTDGYAEYDASAPSTTISAASNGASLPQGTINVASTAGFPGYVNLTVQSSTGPQSVFCRTLTATAFGECVFGTGTLATGNHVVQAPPSQFDVYTVSGLKAAVSTTSLTLLSDVPAANRGMPSTAVGNANNGLVTYVQSAAPTGNFSLTYGICRSGTATYSAGNANCATGVIHYRPGVTSNLGGDVSVSVPIFGTITTHVYQSIDTAIVTPSTIGSGQSFTARIAPSPGAIPRKQASSSGDATVNASSRFTSVYPIPAGMTFQSARLIGGDAKTAGVATVNYCIATSSPCSAKLTGSWSGTSTPYLIVTLPTSVSIDGGSTVTMPTLEVTMTASGTAGTVGQYKLTEIVNTTAATLIINTTATFDGYPTTGNADVTPPPAPANVLATTTIT